MAITEQTPRNVSTATAGATLFPYDFKILAKGDLLVQVDGVTKTVDVEFTVDGVGQDSGGNIEFVTPLVGGETVMRKRSMKLERLTDFQNLGDLRSPTLNNDQDAPVMMIQQLAESVARAVALPLDSTGSAQLPALQALKPLVVNATASGFEFGDTELTGDMLLRTNLTGTGAAEGSNLVAHVSPYLPSPSATYLKWTSDILNGLEVPIGIFLRNEELAGIRDFETDYDCSADWQKAFEAGGANGIHLLVSRGLYNLPSQMATAFPNVSLRGVGRPVLRVGEGQAAGYIPFSIRHSGFAVSGFKVQAAAKTHLFYIQPQSAETLTGFHFIDLEGEGLFYMGRGDGGADRLIHDVIVSGCKNIAPLGTNCGHFMFDHVVGLKYIGNTIRNGNTTSGFGVADGRDIVIVGNIEQGMEDTAGATEAACQIEDCEDANAVIIGNTFQHDIWVSGSGNVRVANNTCRRLRVSVGNADGYDVRKVTFAKNTAAQIHVAKFGTGTPAERIQARFLGNDLDPAGRTVNGAAISSLAYAEGSYITELELVGNKAISDASTYAMQATRASGATFRLRDNDFGAKAHSVSGSGGKLYERGNSNKVTKTANGYVEAALTSTFAISAGAWQATVLNTEAVDVNGEWSGSTFTPQESGTYRFSGIMTVDPDAAGSQVGFRLYRTSGTAAELARLAFVRAADANSHGIPLRTVELYLAAGDVVQLEHFFSGATTQFVAGATVSTLQVTRID